MTEKNVFVITLLCEPQMLQEYGCFKVQHHIVFQLVIMQ